ncbi:MAG TPA: HesA/MoeB/ThiF family protein [Candidatus Methanomethylicus sp.]|jgi:molybdopterin/thiamine biosynthesis adenylyltransferase|nr:HesA/MoeB/ThiF family protein [Candidatus Methanomethylicus sp.]
MVELTAQERIRYDRQMLLRGWGEEAQRKVKAARVAIAGVGGLGSPVALYLAAAGVGFIRIIDHDIVNLSNLNRQIAHWGTDLGRPKVESAAMKLTQLNSDVKIDAVNEVITPDTANDLFRDVDIVLDCLDSLGTRLLVNSECVRRRIPFIYTAIYGMEGYMTAIVPGIGPCLRCIYPHDSASSEKFPVLGTTPGVMGCLEATEALKHITGIGTLAIGRLVVYDGERMQFDSVMLKRSPACTVCSGFVE